MITWTSVCGPSACIPRRHPRAGDPVEFYDNATYVCDGEDLYFEWDRDMAEFNVTCLPGGAWELPDEWPRCVACQFVKFRITLINM